MHLSRMLLMIGQTHFMPPMYPLVDKQCLWVDQEVSSKSLDPEIRRRAAVCLGLAYWPDQALIPRKKWRFHICLRRWSDPSVATRASIAGPAATRARSLSQVSRRRLRVEPLLVRQSFHPS